MIPNISQGHFNVSNALYNTTLPFSSTLTPISSNLTPMMPVPSPMLAIGPPMISEPPPIINCPNPLENDLYNQSCTCFSYPTVENVKVLFKTIDLYAKTFRYSTNAKNLVMVSLNHVFSLRQPSKEIISESLEGFSDEFNAFLFQTISFLPDPIKLMFAHINLDKKINKAFQDSQISNQIIANNHSNSASNVQVSHKIALSLDQAPPMSSLKIPEVPSLIPEPQSQLKNKKKRKGKTEEDQDFKPGNLLEGHANNFVPKKKSKSKKKAKTLETNKFLQPPVSQISIENTKNAHVNNTSNHAPSNQTPDLTQVSISNQPAMTSHSVDPNQSSNYQAPKPKLISQQIIERAWYLNPNLSISTTLTMPSSCDAYHNLSSLQKESLDKVYKQFQMEIVKVFKTNDVILFLSEVFQNKFGSSYIDIQSLLAKRKENHHKILKSMMVPFVNLFKKLQYAELAFVSPNIFSTIWFNAIISSSLVLSKYDSYFVADFCSLMNLEFDIGNVADYLLVGLWFSTEYFRKNKFIIGFHVNDEIAMPSLQQKYKRNLLFILSRKVEEMFPPF